MAHDFQSANAVETNRKIHEGLRLWLLMNVSEALEIDPATMDTNWNLNELGLDCLQATCIAGYLEEWLGLRIPETVLEDYPTIESACDFIMKMIPESESERYRSVASRYILEIETETEYSRPATRDFRDFILTAP